MLKDERAMIILRTEADASPSIMETPMTRFLLLALFPTVVFAAPDALPNKDVEVDFTMVCEVSKLSKTLSKKPMFKDNAGDLSKRLSEMTLAALKTPEALTTYKDVLQTNQKDRQNMWQEAAKEAGLKNWKCPTAGLL